MHAYPSQPPCIKLAAWSTVGKGGHRVDASMLAESLALSRRARPPAIAATLRIGMHATVDSTDGTSAEVAGELALSRRSNSSFGWGSENT